MNKKRIPSLATCILLDLMGMSSYLLPVVGEAFDFIWAPVSGILFFFLFGRKRFGTMGGVFALLEEISPGLDIVPTFTIAYLVRNIEAKVPVLAGVRSRGGLK